MLVGGNRCFLNKMIDEHGEKCVCVCVLESFNILLKRWGYNRRVEAFFEHLSPVSISNAILL